VKFTNTLVLRRDGQVFPPSAGPHMYLSGLPLHPLALATAALMAQHGPEDLPFSFSAGVDRHNAAELVASGLTPLTLCTDLLRRGGQGRLSGIVSALENRLVQDGFITLAQLQGRFRSDLLDEEGRRQELIQASNFAEQDPRYHAEAVMKAPRKVKSALQRMDCLSCDICLPVCPNGALFTWATPAGEGRRPAQIGVLADACNACSNCETWCPELGAPWRVKERWHQDAASLLAASPELDGACRLGLDMLLRLEGQLLRYRPSGARGGDELWLATEAHPFLPQGDGPSTREDWLRRARLLWLGLATPGSHPVHSLGLGFPQ
jgi:putative selenate reductase